MPPMTEAVTDNLPCVGCGYELRGLREDGICPECATPISRSLRGDRLSAADLTWLRQITRGQRLVAIAMLTAAVCFVTVLFLAVALLFAVVIRTPDLPDVVDTLVGYGLVVIVIAVFAAAVAGAVGVFLVTAQESRESEREPLHSARNIARWASVGTIVAIVGTMAMRQAGLLPGMMQLAADLAVRLLLVTFVTAAAGGLLKWLATIVRRVPDDALAKRIDRAWKIMRWAVPAAGIFLLVLPNFQPMIGGAGGGPGRLVVSSVIALFSCAGFIATIWLLVMSIRLAGIMRQCAKSFRFCLHIALQEATAPHDARSDGNITAGASNH